MGAVRRAPFLGPALALWREEVIIDSGFNSVLETHFTNSLRMQICFLSFFCYFVECLFSKFVFKAVS